MGIFCDDAVLIQKGNKPGEPCSITINCPDKAGLGCDLCRIILEFGLCIARGDFSTDGRWCYIVFSFVPCPSSLKIDWESLKNRLLSACPSPLFSYCFNQQYGSSPSPVYMLKLFCLDRNGLLHDVTKVLSELEFTIERVKVMTTPDGRVLDLFFITDGMELLHTKKRQDDTCARLLAVLGEFNVICEIQLAGPEYRSQQGCSSLSPEIAEELFGSELLDNKSNMTKLENSTITVDNFLSPAHTLLQIQCLDQKGLFYDIMRTSKDCNIQIAYGRFNPSVKGYRNMDLFIQKTDGKKIIDPEYQASLCSRLKEEMLHPLRVTITSRGPDAELLVANPVELSGKGRPRVFYDVTCTLKTLGICIFSGEIVRHSTSNREWEVYRFRLEESVEFPLTSSRSRSQIVDRVKRTLMGW